LALIGSLAATPLGQTAFADTVEDVARTRFEEGTKAFAAGDYARAGEAFEAANAAKPHEDALYNAAQSWERAGELARAANLYRAYLRLAPEGASDKKHVFDALSALSKQLGRIEVVGETVADLTVDARPATLPEVFVVPGEHLVAANLGKDSERASRVVYVAAGAIVSVVLEHDETGGPEPGRPAARPTEPSNGEEPKASPAPTAAVEPKPAPALGPKRSMPPMVERRGISPWFAATAGGLTVASGAFLIASGVDVLNEKSQYDTLKVGRTPAGQQDLIDQGVHATDRTNALIGVTSALALTTGLLLVFTDYGPSTSKTAPPNSVRLEIGPGGAVLDKRF
jgi:hypothetical protein